MPPYIIPRKFANRAAYLGQSGEQSKYEVHVKEFRASGAYNGVFIESRDIIIQNCSDAYGYQSEPYHPAH